MGCACVCVWIYVCMFITRASLAVLLSVLVWHDVTKAIGLCIIGPIEKRTVIIIINSLTIPPDIYVPFVPHSSDFNHFFQPPGRRVVDLFIECTRRIGAGTRAETRSYYHRESLKFISNSSQSSSPWIFHFASFPLIVRGDAYTDVNRWCLRKSDNSPRC